MTRDAYYVAIADGHGVVCRRCAIAVFGSDIPGIDRALESFYGYRCQMRTAMVRGTVCSDCGLVYDYLGPIGKSGYQLMSAGGVNHFWREPTNLEAMARATRD